MTSLQERVAFLDAALTRKDWKTVTQSDHIKLATVGTFIHNIYYLSDGGYSRLHWDFERRSLHLVADSRQAVKENWKNCRELIADVEREIINLLKAEGWD